MKKTLILLSLLFSCCILLPQQLDSLQLENLYNIAPGQKYQHANFYKLNPRPNYYGKNIMQLVITKLDTAVNEPKLLNITLWTVFITFRKADSVITKVIDRWTGTSTRTL